MKFCQTLLLLLILGITGIKSQGTYKAAVVEYAPLKNNEGVNRMLENAVEYGKYMEQAQKNGASIIVFPEYGLTHIDVLDSASKLESSAVFIPDPDPIQAIAPCNVRGKYSKVLEDLSCEVITRGIYAIVNLIEKVNGTSNNIIYYNTNIVFDKNGGIIARYRKINLYKEPGLTPGNETVTFKTDFGATFGVFTCYDLVHKNPAREILKNEQVTNIVFPTAWYSETPFAVSLSTQLAYSRSNNVNLLAANLNYPRIGMGGSGIYVSERLSSETYISASEDSKLILKDVYFPNKRNTDKVCDSSLAPSPTPRGSIGGSLGGGNRNISDFVTNIENMNNYTFKSLSGDSTYEKICTEGGNFCCTFNITVQTLSSVSDYTYKIASFYGVRDTGDGTIGMAVCALVACENDDIATCGSRSRTAPAKTVFKHIEISGTFSDNDNTTYWPMSLQTNLEPSPNLAYCVESASYGNVNVKVASPNPVDSLLSFGIVGRLHNYDNEAAGPRNSAVTYSPTMLFVSLVSYIIMRIYN